jgi:hypothetical protein
VAVNILIIPFWVFNKMKFTLEQAMKAQRGRKNKLYSLFNLAARWG